MADYDELYSFTIQSECNDDWILVSSNYPDHEAQNKNTDVYWCWTDSGSTSSGTGPPSGYPCIYPETSSPTNDADWFTCELRVALDASVYGFFVEFNRSTQGNAATIMYFEAWDGSDWNVIDSWTGDSVTSWTAEGPYDLSSYDNADFKVRVRVEMPSSGNVYHSDFTWDEVRIYGDFKAAHKIEGVTKDSAGNPLGSCAVRLYRTSNDSYEDSVVSNASTGAYAFTGLAQDYERYAIVYKDGSSDVFGTSDDLTPVEE